VLQAALQRVGALPCFDLHKLAGDLKALGLRELSERVALGHQPRRNIYLRRLQKTREARPKFQSSEGVNGPERMLRSLTHVTKMCPVSQGSKLYRQGIGFPR